MQDPGNPSRPELSVLTVSWNCWADLERLLESLRASDYSDFEILVCDNQSTDGTLENLRERYPEVRVLRNSENLGHTRAVNQGVPQTRGRFVLLLDADTKLAPNAMRILVEFMKARGDVSLAAPKVLNADGTVQESARNFPSALNGLFGRQSLLTRWFPGNRFSSRYLRRDALEATEPYQVQQVSAACMIFPRALFDLTGPWDEGYFAYWVDTDWCMTLGELGKQIFCVPEARVVHYENNRAGRKKSARRVVIFHRSAYRLYRKHYTWGAADPRALFALVALSMRAALLIAAGRLVVGREGDG